MRNNEQHFLVAWIIDLWAEDEQEAAEKALEIQRDPESIATSFLVTLNEPGAQDLFEEFEVVDLWMQDDEPRIAVALLELLELISQGKKFSPEQLAEYSSRIYENVRSSRTNN